MQSHFLNAGEGLIPAESRNLKGFTIAASDRIFYEANAIIDGDKVLVWNDVVLIRLQYVMPGLIILGMQLI